MVSRSPFPEGEDAAAAPPSSPSARATGGFWFALSQRQRDALRTLGGHRIYPAKATLMCQGDEANHVVIIQSGWAKVTTATEDGHHVLLALRGPGDLVGESAVLGTRLRSATVTALSPVRSLVVSGARFVDYLNGDPVVWRTVSAVVMQRLEDADSRLQTHISAKGAQRLAAALVHLAELSVLGAPPNPDGSVDIAPPLSQEELGSYIDASRETVARAFNTLRKLGLVRTGWRRITVLDLPRLATYANGKPLGQK